MTPKTIELFLVNGTADSVVIADVSNWNGKAIKVPRIDVTSCGRDELDSVGVYFLICTGEFNNKDAVYIGESENILTRLKEHIHDYGVGKEKFYWNTVIAFTGVDLDKTSIRFLENKLVTIARDCGRYEILTKKTYKGTIIKESREATLNEYVEYVKLLINTLGYKVLEKISDDNDKKTNNVCHFYISRRGSNATGYISDEGFVVTKESIIAKAITQSFKNENYNVLREKLISEKIIDNFAFTKDYLFNSPSAAAGVVVGNSTSGRNAWKTKEGKTLGDYEKDSSN